jgi:hypothetical protein
MNYRYIVIVPSLIGNVDSWYTDYFWDGLLYQTKLAAIKGGWKIHDHDDWLIGVVRDDQLVSVSWMDDPPRDAEETASVAAGIGMEVLA